MPAVRRTIHLAYTMGHTAGSGRELRNDDVAAHALRLARELHDLRPDDTEAVGLLALILLTEARAGTRLAADGTQVLLADADRHRWDRRLASRGPGAGRRPPSCPSGSARSGRSPRTQRRPAGPPGGHRRRARPRRDVRRHRLGGASSGCYDALLTIEPSPTIALGRCVALSYLVDAGDRAGRRRRGHRRRWSRALPVRPRRPSPDARAPRSGRRRHGGVGGRRRRAPAPTPSGRSSPTRA